MERTSRLLQEMIQSHSTQIKRQKLIEISFLLNIVIQSARGGKSLSLTEKSILPSLLIVLNEKLSRKRAAHRLANTMTSSQSTANFGNEHRVSPTRGT